MHAHRTQYVKTATA